MAEVAVKSAKVQKSGTDKKKPVSSKSAPELSQAVDSPVKQVLYLQKTIGNRAVTRLIQSGTIQAKLKIGQPNDIYEKEADSVSEQVMRMRDGALVNGHPSLGKQVTPSIQRQEKPEEEEEKNQEEEEQIQTKPLIQREKEEKEEEGQAKSLIQHQEDEEKEKQPLFQKKEESEEENEEMSVLTKSESGSTPGVNPGIESSTNSIKGGGHPLSESTRAFFEPRFGVDFSHVRVHTDSKAGEVSKSLNARAFTTGKDIVFGSGQYSPDTSSGKRLLAHELTHTLQQSLRRSHTVKPTLQSKASNSEEEKPGPPVRTNTETLPEPVPTPSENIATKPPDEASITETPPESADTASTPKAAERATADLKEGDLLTSLMTSKAQSLEQEAEMAAKQAVEEKEVNVGVTPSNIPIQFDLLSGIGSIVRRGLSWARRRIIQPIRRMASSALNVVRGLGRRISNAYRQANANAWDIAQPQYLFFRVMRNLRRKLYSDAINEERRRRANRASRGPTGTGGTSEREPSFLERTDQIVSTFESGAEAYFEVNREIVEGAILGDFKENPTIWNTIGQIAIGFVPYAGQAADIRDLIASLKKIIFEGKHKDPWEWFNLLLVIIGIIPGIGDAIKAIGRGAKNSIRKGVRKLLKHGDDIWRAVSRRTKSIMQTARGYGRQLIRGASQIGRKLLRKSRQIGRRVLNSARSVSRRVRGLIGRLRTRVSSLANSAQRRGRSILNRAGGLLGGAIGAAITAARRALGFATNLIHRGLRFVGNKVKEGIQVINRIGRRIANRVREAANFLRTSLRRAIARGREMLTNARRRAAEFRANALRRGRELATQGYNRVTNLINGGLRWVKQKAIRWIIEKFQNVKQRLLNFLRKTYYRIRRTRPSDVPDPGHRPRGRRTRIGAEEDPTVTRSLRRENDSADALAQAGYRVEQNPDVPGSRNPDYRIEGRIFDNYAPSSTRPRNIWSEIQENKVNTGQADRIVLNLDDSAVDINLLRRQFNDWHMPGLKEVIVVRNGRVIPFWP